MILKYVNKERDLKKLRTILLIVIIIMWVGEIYKQYDYYRHGDWGIGIVNSYNWYVFPFQFCGTPLYVIPLILLIPHQKTRQILLTYMASYALFAGMAAFFVPVNVFRDRLGIDIQTMLHHVLMIWLGLYLWKVDLAGTVKDFIKAGFVFLSAVSIAFILNLSLHNLSGGIINLFYINPHLETTLPLLGHIQKIHYSLFIIVYLFVFILAASLVYFSGYKLNHKKKQFF